MDNFAPYPNFYKEKLNSRAPLLVHSGEFQFDQRSREVIGELIMSTDVMMEKIAGASPRLRARTAGALWLIIIVAASFSEFFVRGRIVVDGDAAATATNILAHEPLYRLGAAAALIYLLCDTAVALILYELFKPVSMSLSLLASFFRLAMVAILSANLLNLFAPLVLLKGAPRSEERRVGKECRARLWTYDWKYAV